MDAECLVFFAVCQIFARSDDVTYESAGMMNLEKTGSGAAQY